VFCWLVWCVVVFGVVVGGWGWGGVVGLVDVWFRVCCCGWGLVVRWFGFGGLVGAGLGMWLVGWRFFVVVVAVSVLFRGG